MNYRNSRHPTQVNQAGMKFQKFQFLRSLPANVVALLIVSFAFLPAGRCQDALPKGTPFDSRVKEILEDSCYSCHGHVEPAAGLDLIHFRTVESVRGTPEVWKQVMRRVMNGSMPPADDEVLEDEERDILAQAVDQMLHAIECATVSHAGSVTIRRLNRVEYRNTIFDLLGYDYAPSANFPGDDVGYGFDNIGDVLSLPPMLMEKYLDAAEEISRQIIQAPEDGIPEDEPLPVNRWTTEGGVNTDSGNLAFYSNGSATIDINFPESEELTIRIVGRGQQAGNEPVKMSVYHNRRKVGQYRLEKDDLPEKVEVARRFPKGKSSLKIIFDNDFYEPTHPDPSRRDRNLIVESVSLIRQQSAAKNSKLHERFFFVRPAKKSEEEATARKLLSVWASRLFRRPAGDEEVERLYQIYAATRRDGESFEKGMQYSLQAMLVSPKFLFRVERPPTADGSPRKLNSYELATNLAYLIWVSAPDEELLKIAYEQDLQVDEALREQTKRLLRDPRAERLAENFAEQWLQLRALSDFTPDLDRFPGAEQELFTDMRRETLMFVAEVIKRDGSVLELLDGEFTYVNRRLANHYGIKASTKDDETFVRVDLKGTNRGGLLTQGSVLSATSNPTRTSPVKRGKWIMENLLGDVPPPALPDVVPLEDQELTGNLREQMEQHRRDPNCASCHEVMDQLGFALENFDAVGKWRTADEWGDVNPEGQLPSGEVFRGAVELRMLLLERKKTQFVRCLTEKMMIYALGRGLQYEDQCAVNEILVRLRENDYRFSELILGIVESKPFRQRQLKTEVSE